MSLWTEEDLVYDECFLLTYFYVDDMRTNMKEDPFLQILMNLNDDESKLNYDRWTHSWYFYVLKIFWEVYNPFSVWFFVWYELTLFYLCLYDLLWSIVYDLIWLICSFNAMTESKMYQLWGWDIARIDNLEPCEYIYLRIFSLEKKIN